MVRKHSSNSSNNTSLNSSQIERTTSIIANISFKKYYGIFLKTVCLAFVLFYVYSYFAKLQAENGKFLNENKTLKSEIKILNEHLKKVNGNLKTLERSIVDYQIKEAKYKSDIVDYQIKLNNLTFLHDSFKNMTEKELMELKKKLYETQFKVEGCDAFSFLNRTYWNIKTKFDNFFKSK